LELTLEAKAVEKKPLPMTVLGLLLDYPILFLPIIALIGLLSVGALRTKNSMGMDLDIFDDETDDQGIDSLLAEKMEEATVEEETVQSEEHTEDRPKKGAIAGEKHADNSQQDAHSDEMEQRPVSRRRIAPAKQSRDGPITTVKRKRLDNTSAVEPTIKKKATRKRVVTQTPVRKTRRVVTKADKEVEDSPGER
jgi:FtsZ-interacting cell division protein ZipA